MKDKKVYQTPLAVEEAFEANSYVAACQWQITSSSGNNRMQCANPKHGHFMNGTYFTSVWIEATNSTCQIKVDRSGIGKTDTNGNNAEPVWGATVYGANGDTYKCIETYTRDKGTRDAKTYYVPSFVNTSSDGGPCYGSYVNTGDYNEIKQKVFS